MKISFLAMTFLLIAFTLPAYAAYEYKGTKLEGELNNGLTLNRVKGNSTDSFVDSGTHFLGQENLRASRESLGGINKMLKSWGFDSEVNVRKTDDRQYDRRRDVHLLYLQAHVYNPMADITFGDLYSNLTDLTMNRSLQGFQGIFNVEKTGTKVTTVFARVFEGEQGFRNTRYVIGDRLEQKIFQDGKIGNFHLLNDIAVGANVVHTFDSSEGVDQDPPLAKLRNTVVSTDLSTRWIENLTSRIEIARSKAYDKNDVQLSGDIWGTAVKQTNEYTLTSRLGDTRLGFDYERYDTNFMSDSGSFSPDREAYYGHWDQRFIRELDFDASYRQFRDNLNDTLTSSLHTKNPVFKITLRPFVQKKSEMWQNLAVLLKYDFSDVKSTDDTVKNQIHIFDGRISHKIKDLSFTGGYNLRSIGETGGQADRNTQGFMIRSGYDFHLNENFSFLPYVEYKYRVERNHDPRMKTSLNDVGVGGSISIFKRFRINTNYGEDDLNLAQSQSDSIVRFFDISSEFDITDRLMLVGSWSIRNNQFEASGLGFDENVGEIKLVWKV